MEKKKKTKENYQIFQGVKRIIEENKIAEESKKDGIFLMAIYKKGKKSESKILMNGFTLEEADVVLRGVYGKIYEMRKRNDVKMQEINKKLQK